MVLPKKKAFLLAVLLGAMIILLTGLVKGSPTNPELYFTILHTNDEHSNLLPMPLVDYHPTEPNPARGGFDRLATLVEAFREAKNAEGEPVLLLSGGDFLGESPLAWLALEGHGAELSFMLELGYDAFVIGNHEFDFGDDILAEYLQAAGYPAAAAQAVPLASNMIIPEGHPLGELGIEKAYLKELDNGLRVGFFGLMGVEAAQVAPFPGEIRFSNRERVAEEMIELLRQEGADLVVLISHMGISEERDLARAVPGIDIIVGGHSHTSLYEPEIAGSTIIISGGDRLRYLGVTEFALDPVTGKLRIRNSDTDTPHLVPVDYSVPPLPKFTASLNYYVEQLNDLVSRMTEGQFTDVREFVVYTDFELPKQNGQETPMGNFVTDAIRIAAEEALGEKVHFAFQASGPIRGGISPGTMPFSKGGVTFYDLAARVGLGTGPDKAPGFPVASAYFTPAEVKKIMEISVFLSQYMGLDYFLQASGLRATYDMSRAVVNVPFIDFPLPTSRGILELELFVGEGVQTGLDDEYIPLSAAEEELFLVATDYAISTAIPLVGEVVPYLRIQPKDREGNPVEMVDRIVMHNGRELKVWQAVLMHTARQPMDSDYNRRIAEFYEGHTGRLIEVNGTPLWLWPGVLMVLLVAGITGLFRRRKALLRRRQLNG